MPPGSATWQSTGVGEEAERVRVKHGQGPLFWSLQELAHFNNFSGLAGVGAHSSCLVPSPGVIKTVEYWP